MRKLPFFLAFSFWSVSSLATMPTSDDLSAFRQNTGCGQVDPNSLDGTPAICKNAELDYCSLTNAPGCPTTQGQPPPPVDWGDGKDPTVAAKGKALLAEGDKLQDASQDCCEGQPENCKLPSGSDAANALKKLTASKGDKAPAADGALQVAGADQDLHQNEGAWKAGVAGVCKSKKFACSFKMNNAATLLESKKAPGCNNCEKMATALRDIAQTCDQMKEESVKNANTAFSNLAKAGASKDQMADKSKEKTDPNSPTAGDKTPTDNKGPSDRVATPGESSKIKPQSADSGGGGMGQALTGMMGAAMQAMQAQQQQQQQQAAAAQTAPDCSNPNIVDPYGRCPAQPAAAASNAWNTQSATAGLQPQTAAKGSFNLPTNPNLAAGAQDPNIPAATPTQNTAAVVPNGGTPFGGGGGGGGGAGAASLGGAAAAAAGMMMAGNKVTDIMHGEHGGGYSQTAANMGAAATGGGGWSGYGGREPAAENWSLADFLPGHSKDPKRALAGGNAQRVQIQSKEVNIWSRISDHIRARCTQGLLRDCIP